MADASTWLFLGNAKFCRIKQPNNVGNRFNFPPYFLPGLYKRDRSATCFPSFAWKPADKETLVKGDF